MLTTPLPAYPWVYCRKKVLIPGMGVGRLSGLFRRAGRKRNWYHAVPQNSKHRLILRR